jgi:hypothetical protein
MLVVCTLCCNNICLTSCYALLLWLQHHIQAGALEQGFSLLLQHLPQISSSSTSLASACVRPWLALLVAAAAAGNADLHSQVAEVIGQWAETHTQAIDTAWVSFQLCHNLAVCIEPLLAARVHGTDVSASGCVQVCHWARDPN